MHTSLKALHPGTADSAHVASQARKARKNQRAEDLRPETRGSIRTPKVGRLVGRLVGWLVNRPKWYRPKGGAIVGEKGGQARPAKISIHS